MLFYFSISKLASCHRLSKCAGWTGGENYIYLLSSSFVVGLPLPVVMRFFKLLLK